MMMDNDFDSDLLHLFEQLLAEQKQQIDDSTGQSTTERKTTESAENHKPSKQKRHPDSEPIAPAETTIRLGDVLDLPVLDESPKTADQAPSRFGGESSTTTDANADSDQGNSAVDVFVLPELNDEPETTLPIVDQDLLEVLPNVPPASHEDLGPDEQDDDSIASRVLGDINFTTNEADYNELAVPNLPSLRDVELPDSNRVLIIRERRYEGVDTTTSPHRFGRLYRIIDWLSWFWNGPLGWASRPTNQWYVAAKVWLRLSFGAGLPLLLVAAVSLTSLGWAFPAHGVDLTDSSLLWGRGIVEFSPRDVLEPIDDGILVSSTTLRTVRHLYADFWRAFDEAVASGDDSELSRLLADTLLTEVKAQVADLRARGLHHEAGGYLTEAELLRFQSATPASNPTRLEAVLPWPSWSAVIDSNGEEITTHFYESVKVTFEQRLDGTWLISALLLIPQSAPPPLPEG